VQISTPTAREGTCVHGESLFTAGTRYVVVDRGHVLVMPEYDATLLASVVTPTRVYGPVVNATDYPGDRGWVASFEVAVTNRHAAPLAFDTTGSDSALLLAGTVYARPEVPYPQDAPGLSFAERGAIAPHATRAAWMSFVVPLWARAQLTARPADLELFRPGDGSWRWIGQIRLWK
jgi:hypothetical protein